MKYIVTGGAGFIGSHIAEALARDHDVTVLDDLSSGNTRNIRQLVEDKEIEFVRGSVTDLRLLHDIFDSADGIFHQAAIASVPRSVRNPAATNEANITGTLNVAIAARDSGAKKIVYASSSSVYGETPTLPKREEMPPDPLSPYAVSKLSGELYLKVFSDLYGLPAVSLRYFNVFGPRQDPDSEYAAVIPKFITRVLGNRPPIIYGDGGQTRDFTYVKDVVQANVKAMESRANGVFNVAYGQRITLNQLAELIMEIAGNRIDPIYDAPRPGDIRDSLADIGRARTAFGYDPEFTVRTGLEETILWYRHQQR
jgi:UDP-glucose 4-epimerase